MTPELKRTCFALGGVCVVLSVGVWLGTGRETFTRWPNAKLESADVAPTEGEEDLLASIGFEEPHTSSQMLDIESRFAMGLVPGGFDPKHLLSVATCTFAGIGLAVFPMISGRLCGNVARRPLPESVA